MWEIAVYPDVLPLNVEASDYTSYSFTKYFNVHDYDSAGNDVTLFRLKMEGTVYFYTDGKVHLYSLSSNIESTAKGYSATVIDNDIYNTDGSLSTGTTTVTTSSNVSFPASSSVTSIIYVYGTFKFRVKFEYGSAQATYNIEEIGIVRPRQVTERRGRS